MPKIPSAISFLRSDGWSNTARRRKSADNDVTVRNDTGVQEGGEISFITIR